MIIDVLICSADGTLRIERREATENDFDEPEPARTGQ